MSLGIDINAIARILLQDGVWYHVLRGTVTVEVFGLTDATGVATSVEPAVVETTGVRFKAQGLNGWISCPLTSIMAIHYESSDTDEPFDVNLPKTLADELGTSL